MGWSLFTAPWHKAPVESSNWLPCRYHNMQGYGDMSMAGYPMGEPCLAEPPYPVGAYACLASACACTVCQDILHALSVEMNMHASLPVGGQRWLPAAPFVQ